MSENKLQNNISLTFSESPIFDPENPPPVTNCYNCYKCNKACIHYEDLSDQENICDECLGGEK